MTSLDTAMLGQEVALPQVAKALHALWADEDGKTRASLMNFVIYSEDPASLPQNTQLLSELTREHSCRAILIVNQPEDAPTQPRAWVTAHCQLREGRRSVCCEQLSFVLEGAGADEVRNVIFAHLDSDLPLVVLWQGELSARLDERLYSVIDSLIIDSSQWQQPAASFARLLEARTSRTSRFTLSDLSWMRSHFMRTALASASQDAALLAELDSVNALRITHAPGNRMSAVMIAAWIAKQLGCTADSVQPEQLERASGSSIALSFSEGTAGSPLQALELLGPNISLSIKRDPESRFIRACIGCSQRTREDLQPADMNDDADLIADQLSRLGGTTLYLEVLPLVQAMVSA